MALEELDIKIPPAELTGGAQAFLTEAERRVDDFFAEEGHKRFPRYLPSDFVCAYDVLSAIQREGLAEGPVFCEWGSGFGIAACFAAILGFEAYGIEIEKELVTMSQALVRDFALPVEITCTSFIPEGMDTYRTPDGESVMLTNDAMLLSERRGAPPPSYENMDLRPEEVDVVYVYPWPGELEMAGELFDTISAEGALLVMYQGPDELYVYQKV